MAKNYPRIGLALGSGGAKGLAHIGVFRSLEKHGIAISYIAGSSVGSIMGALYAHYYDSKKLEALVLALTRKKGMRLFDLTVRGGLLKGNKMELFIREILEDAQFKDLKVPLSVVATDFNTAEPVVFTSGDLIRAIRASIAVPAIYQPIFYKDRLLADGGLSNPVPVSIASKMGADITIAVNLDHVYVENPFRELPALMRIPMHAINILRHNLALREISNADVIITPENKAHIGLMGWGSVFDHKKATKIIEAGEIATDKKIPELLKKIEEYNKNHSYINRFVSVFKKR
ncbi:MAG TPA: patatin-like phospholipase family protein [Candidatus Saccharimonadales bacterium]|nr:patatin-like phospholipase family protein [Candidatus Saccharimonadales bacterium]